MTPLRARALEHHWAAKQQQAAEEEAHYQQWHAQLAVLLANETAEEKEERLQAEQNEIARKEEIHVQNELRHWQLVKLEVEQEEREIMEECEDDGIDLVAIQARNLQNWMLERESESVRMDRKRRGMEREDKEEHVKRRRLILATDCTACTVLRSYNSKY